TSWYHAADAFVFPSVNEGWGLVVLEAQVAGLPVIVSDIAVFREYLNPDTAMFVPSGDAAALEVAMRRLMTAPDLRHRLVRAAGIAATRYSWDACAQRHHAIYRGLQVGRDAGVA
ncbi:MAG TPA: glycosyltransferase, partial [Candidatus Dormibacteraeota bacterium]|nr:glycosyltransferase [Candidatus Dormibacteraeota bacterium]